MIAYTSGIADIFNPLSFTAVSLLFRKLPSKIGDALTPQQYKDIEELGILADKDDQVSSAFWHCKHTGARGGHAISAPLGIRCAYG